MSNKVHRQRMLRLGALGVGFVLFGVPVLQACGSDEDASVSTAPLATTGATENTTSATVGDTTSPPPADSEALAEAKAFVEQYSQPITSVDTWASEPLTTLPSGKSAVVVSLSIASAEYVWDKFTEANELLGISTTKIDGGGTPETFANAMKTAVGMDPDIIVSQGFPPETYQDVIEPYLEDGGILFGYAMGIDGTSPLVSAEFLNNAELEESARAQARWIAADANGEVKHVVSAWIPDFPTMVVMQAAFEDELAQVAPQITHEALAAKVADVGTALPGQVVSAIQRNGGDADYFVAGFGDIAFGVPEAFAAAGITDIKGITSYGTPANYQLIQEGSTFVVDWAQPLGVFGYIMADAGARLLAGDEVAPIVPFSSPYQFLTTEDMTFDVSEFWEPDYDYEAAFRELWNV